MKNIALVILSAFLAIASVAVAAESDNRILNSEFSAPGEGGLPAGWAAWMPLWDNAACLIQSTQSGLLVKSGKEPFGVGGVTQQVKGVQGGQAYRFQADAKLAGIDSPLRSVMVRMNWTKAGQALTPHGWLVRGQFADGARALFDDVLVAPSDADGAIVQLEVKWPKNGSVLWQSVNMRACPTPAPRKAKLGAVYLKPQNSTVEKNLDLWCGLIDDAGKLKLDALCLGEAILSVGTGKNVKELAEPIPGPTTARLAGAAKRNHMYVVAGIAEAAGGRVYNTAILLDRDGNLAGKYRKVHLPREEWSQGVTPGFDYPVFQTDIGPVAIQICYDWFYPEAAESFALNGARILFAPTWGTTFPDQDGRAEGQTVFRVRARDNGLFLVACVYDGSSLVIDPLGRLLASKKGQGTIAWAEVDLDTREPLFWVGNWRDVGPRDRMPDTYKSMLSTDGVGRRITE
jgi:predicted amidohydrolase